MERYVYEYFFNFSTQLFIMEAAFSWPLPRKEHFAAKLIGMLAVYYGAGVGLLRLIRRIPASYYPMEIVYYLLLFGVTMFMMHILFDVRRRDILFVGTAGYAAQHITYALTQACRYMIRSVLGADAIPWIVDKLVLNFLVFAAAGVIFYKILVKKYQERELKDADIRMSLVSACVLLSSIVLSVMGEGLDTGNGIMTSVICRLYAVIACSLGIAMQFDLSSRNKLESQNEILEQLLHMEKQQHEMSKENIDIINIKCHDLKYQIQALEGIDNENLRREKIEEFQKSVMIYDSMVKSGNDAVDLVLTEKSLICQKYNIKFTYIIDGKRLSFMNAADIYSLFGNALDNAIASVIREPEEKRIISLNVAGQQDMLFIHMENECSDELRFEDGLPVTTKEDKRFHGFGTRSIRYIAQKYGGEVEMSHQNGKFILDILF